MSKAKAVRRWVIQRKSDGLYENDQMWFGTLEKAELFPKKPWLPARGLVAVPVLVSIRPISPRKAGKKL